MLGYLSLDIICSSKLTVFLELRSRKTVRFSEQIMSADKYPSIFSRQMEAIVYIFPSFQNWTRCEKDLKTNKHNSLHLGRKCTQILALGHYLFLQVHSFPPATLSENCSLLRTDNVRGQTSEHIFAPNRDYCLCIVLCCNLNSLI